MRSLLLGVVCLSSACLTPSERRVEFISYGHLSLSAETLPVWDDPCLQKVRVLSHWAVSLVLQRDRILDVPEWVSGHRYALTAACETFSPELLVLETPPSDTLFYPADSLAREAWQNALQAWILDELLPTISTYPSLVRIAWGKGFTYLGLPERFWEALLQAVRRAAPLIQWGFVSDKPTAIPFYPQWNFIGIFVTADTTSEKTTFAQAAPKPVLYFLRDKEFPLHKLPPADSLLGVVFYSESCRPVMCL